MKAARLQRDTVNVSISLILLLLGSTNHAGSSGVVTDRHLFQAGTAERTLVQRDTVVRSRTVEVDLAVTRKARPGDTIALNLFDDLVLTGLVERRSERSLEQYSLSGRVIGIHGGEFFLVAEGNIVVGDFRLPSLGVFQLRLLQPSIHVIHEIDGEKATACAGALEPSDEPPSAPQLESPSAAEADDGSTFDVLVVYTPAARDAAGGTAGMHAVIQLVVDYTNQAYLNSAMNPRIRLVGRSELAYDETGSNLAETLDRLRLQSDGFMDEVHQLRSSTGADLVSLITDGFPGGGVGYVMIPSFFGQQMAPFAFSVVEYFSDPSRTFAHELGHNMGCCHQNGSASCIEGTYPYSFGYRFASDNSSSNSTIMAGSSVAHFSNPNVLFDGAPTGIADPSPDSADNARTINENANVIAQWEQSNPSLDNDGDGFSNDDCDDFNASIYPGSPELCDGVSNDCDAPGWPAIPAEEEDSDSDGFFACGDCDDSSSLVFPGATQLCDGVNNDCDDPSWPAVPPDEMDQDGDTWRICEGDCDDGNSVKFPFNAEICDDLDNDCDGTVDGFPTSCGVGACAATGSCAAGIDSCTAGTPSAEECDGIDNDCDGTVPPEETDVDGDGYSGCNGDCDDGNPLRFPGNPEICDGVDNDCDGTAGIDEIDDDGDGILACVGDCDDADPAVYPGSLQVCDGINNDCSDASWPSVPADECFSIANLRLSTVAGDIRLDWDVPAGGADTYRVYRGQAADFVAGINGGYCLASSTKNSLESSDEIGSGDLAYYVVAGLRGLVEGSRGPDSGGVERLEGDVCGCDRLLSDSSPIVGIPDADPIGISDTINFPDSLVLADADIEVEIDHTFFSDLTIDVTHAGTTIRLWDRSCPSWVSVGMEVTFDDEGEFVDCGDSFTPLVADLPPTVTGTGPLSAFDSLDAQGDWTITVRDEVTIDTGTLVNWAIRPSGSNDADGDRLCDPFDYCPADAANDLDADLVCGNVDNCPTVMNPDQVDTDGDGVGDACETTGCAHEICAEGTLLDPACDTCVALICGIDSICCVSEWDSICVGEVTSICGITCEEACAHDICVPGVALDPACDPCVQTVCSFDPFCCGTAWDSVCVGEVVTFCGTSCP